LGVWLSDRCTAAAWTDDTVRRVASGHGEIQEKTEKGWEKSLQNKPTPGFPEPEGSATLHSWAAGFAGWKVTKKTVPVRRMRLGVRCWRLGVPNMEILAKCHRAMANFLPARCATGPTKPDRKQVSWCTFMDDRRSVSHFRSDQGPRPVVSRSVSADGVLIFTFLYPCLPGPERSARPPTRGKQALTQAIRLNGSRSFRTRENRPLDAIHEIEAKRSRSPQLARLPQYHISFSHGRVASRRLCSRTAYFSRKSHRKPWGHRSQ